MIYCNGSTSGEEEERTRGGREGGGGGRRGSEVDATGRGMGGKEGEINAGTTVEGDIVNVDEVGC